MSDERGQQKIGQEKLDLDLFQVDHNFRYHRPTQAATRKHEDIRHMFQMMAYRIVLNLPDSRDRSLVLTNLEQAHHWAHACIAKHYAEQANSGDSTAETDAPEHPQRKVLHDLVEIGVRPIEAQLLVDDHGEDACQVAVQAFTDDFATVQEPRPEWVTPEGTLELVRKFLPDPPD